eukprot:gene1995-biopygen1812
MVRPHTVNAAQKKSNHLRRHSKSGRSRSRHVQECSKSNVTLGRRCRAHMFPTSCSYHTHACTDETIFCNTLFTEFQKDPADDYVRHDQLQDPNAAFQQQHIYMCLVDIQNNLHVYGKSLQQFPEIPQLPANYAQPQQADDEINTEQEQEKGQQMLEKLNPEQLQIHSAIVLAIETQSTDNCFLLDGQARTGKTFFYNTLVHNLQASEHKVKCVAYSGKAAMLLIHCRTAQSKFQIPVPLLHNSTCNVEAQSSQGQQLQDSTQFIWKEASTIPATALKAVDSLPRERKSTNLLAANTLCLAATSDNYRQHSPTRPVGFKQHSGKTPQVILS